MLIKQQKKKLYFDKLIKHSTNKTKTMWKLVKPEINRQESTDKFPPRMDGKLVKDHQELAKMFNEYFINITTNESADKLTNKPIATDNLFSVYKETFPQIHMAPTTTKEIKYIIK
jgi:hypothetical protein